MTDVSVEMSHFVGLTLTLAPRGVPAGLQSTAAAWRTDSRAQLFGSESGREQEPLDCPKVSWDTC